MGDQYRLQLIRLSRALREKLPEYEQRYDKVILLHDNAQLHVAKVVKKYLETLKWDILPHPSYSPDIAPSITGCSEGCSTIWQIIGSLLSQKSKIGSPPKTSHFFEMEFENCEKRWEKIVGSDGQYFNWSVHSFCFKINAFLNTKKRIELICTPNKSFVLLRGSIHSLNLRWRLEEMKVNPKLQKKYRRSVCRREEVSQLTAILV